VSRPAIVRIPERRLRIIGDAYQASPAEPIHGFAGRRGADSLRYDVKIEPPESQNWAVVAGVIDPSGVLWRFAELLE
jgi:hypothetical protein